MGLPSGTMWARTNIDVSQPNGFAESDIQLEASYFSWGNIDGHNANGDSFSPYDWGSGVDQEPYRSSQGATIRYPDSLDMEHDAARAVLGSPWMIPSSSDFDELLANCDFIDADGVVITGANKLITINDVVGIRLRSKINGNVLFFAACGFGEGSSLASGDERGYYWCSQSAPSDNAMRLWFNSSNVSTDNPMVRYHGCTIRPIFRV